MKSCQWANKSWTDSLTILQLLYWVIRTVPFNPTKPACKVRTTLHLRTHFQAISHLKWWDSLSTIIIASFISPTIMLEFPLCACLYLGDIYFLQTLAIIKKSWIIFGYTGFCKTGHEPTLRSSNGNFCAKSDQFST
jgi:hypothetical protein